MSKLNKYLIMVIVIGCMWAPLYAQDIDNTFQTRTEFKLSYKLSKKWKIQATPELRLDDSFSIDKYIIELKTIYNPFKKLALGASYRFVANTRETKPTEYIQRYAFDAKYNFKFDRWKPLLCLRYTNYSEDDADGEFLRYKAGVEYNIRKCKLSPFAGAELFHEFNNQELFKVRYSLGSDYKLSKKHAISVAYKLDYYMQKFENKHILYFGYKFKL
ncbi:DUF2490 domain-containing protein [Carboxylicivirga sp. M1479]|uniref:DUF2490 domain-containing protein n=1 Tax=Carboxylicivirga sp. M1479 TaxID=2594476 RepID=UPI00163DAF58|nr:DUF2490 domain-containing protein [Carboxylicivirga sp. M1479]